MDWYNRSSFRFAGGSDTVAKAMEQVLSGYGAEIRKRCKATKIICDDTKATGVEINGEEIVNADIVISTAHPARTMELLEGTKLIRPAFRRRIANMPQTTGVFSLYLHFKENIAGFHTSTPLTYRDYTGTERGALYGVAKDVSLGISGRVPHKTRIPNVFMAGQNINSHGMLGVIVGTIVVCSELLTPEYVYGQIMEA